MKERKKIEEEQWKEKKETEAKMRDVRDWLDKTNMVVIVIGAVYFCSRMLIGLVKSMISLLSVNEWCTMLGVACVIALLILHTISE